MKDKQAADLPPPNYTAVPNLFLDEVLGRIESMSELKVTLAIMRKTFGWQKKADRISVGQLVSATGLSEQSVRNGLQSGMERGTIKRTPDGQTFRYSLNIKPEGVQDLDPPKSCTPLKVVPDPPQDLDPEGVQDLDPQKKPEKKLKENTKSHSEAGASARSPVRAIFDYWREKTGRTKAQLTPERERAVRNRLKSYTAEDIMLAVDGCCSSPFHMGQNDQQKRHDDLTLICRNGSKLEDFMALASPVTHAARPRAAPIRACTLCGDTGTVVRMNFDTKQDERVDCSCRKKTDSTAKPQRHATTH